MLSNKILSLWLMLVCLFSLVNITMAISNSTIKKEEGAAATAVIHEKRWYGTTTTTTMSTSTIDCGTTATDTPTPVVGGHRHNNSSSGDQQTTLVCSKCIQPPPKYDTAIIIGAVLLMLTGVYLMAAGFFLFRITMGFVGLILGAAITWISLHAAEPQVGYPSPAIFYLGCSLLGGIFVAVLSVFCWKVTIYFLCGMAGYLLSLFIWGWKEDFMLQNILARQIIGLGLGFLFILGFVLVEFATIILSLSFMGAYIFILGLDLFMKTGFVIGFRNILYFDRYQYRQGDYLDASVKLPITDWTDANYKLDTKVYGMLCGVFGLWIVGTAWQRWFNRGSRFGLHVIENTNNTLKVEKYKEYEK